jgi:hypothetical protein
MRGGGGAAGEEGAADLRFGDDAETGGGTGEDGVGSACEEAGFCVGKESGVREKGTAPDGETNGGEETRAAA